LGPRNLGLEARLADELVERAIELAGLVPVKRSTRTNSASPSEARARAASWPWARPRSRRTGPPARTARGRSHGSVIDATAGRQNGHRRFAGLDSSRPFRTPVVGHAAGRDRGGRIAGGGLRAGPRRAPGFDGLLPPWPRVSSRLGLGSTPTLHSFSRLWPTGAVDAIAGYRRRHAAAWTTCGGAGFARRGADSASAGGPGDTSRGGRSTSRGSNAAISPR